MVFTFRLPKIILVFSVQVQQMIKQLITQLIIRSDILNMYMLHSHVTLAWYHEKDFLVLFVTCI